MEKHALRLLLLILLCGLLSGTVFADMGPHESVEVIVETDRLFYAALLSPYPGTGPVGVWEEPPRTAEELAGMGERERAPYVLASYADPDGYYLLNQFFSCRNGSFKWGYMPPSTFKILLWFPDTGELLCSETTSVFAFDSVYRVTLVDDGTLRVSNVRDVTGQIGGFLARLAATLLLEGGLALAFRFRLKPVIYVNLFTQIGLNLLLALNAHNMGSSGYYFNFFYLLLELLVVLIEWGLYLICRVRPVPQPGEGKQGVLQALTAGKQPGRALVFLYALLANALSFGAGLLLNRLIPLAF